MRKVNYIWAVLFFLGAVGCSQEEPNETNGKSDGLVRITLEAPQMMQTRAPGANTNSAGGGVTNVDWALYDLRYQLAVYDETGTKQVITTKTKTVADGYSPVSFEFRLIPGHTYKFVSWADFVNEGTTTDLHYETTDLSAITMKDAANAQLNDESRDAYFITKNIAITNVFNETLTLKRPFAKLRVVTTDWDYENLPMPDNFKVTYRNCTRFEGVNAVTGEAISADGNTAGESLDDTGKEFTAPIATSKGEKYYKKGYDEDPANRTLFVDYLFVNAAQQPIHFKLEMFDGTTPFTSREFTTNIPVQRNWLTTLIGNLLTTKGSVTVSIDDKFTNEHVVNWWEKSNITPTKPNVVNDVYHIATREDFAWLSDNVKEVVGKTVVLDNDIDMDGVDWKPIYIEDYARYTFDGQNHTIRNVSVNGKFGAMEGSFLKARAYIGVFGRFAGEMKNVTFENIVINGLADSAVDEDENGNSIDHSKETAYFAGVVGHAGQNWPAFTNVHVKNITVKASSNQRASSVGGLVGFGGSRVHLTNCSVTGANLIGYETGGLIGKVVQASTIVDCKTENITIRIRPYLGQTVSVSGLVGKIQDGAAFNGDFTTFQNCMAPTRLTLINDKDGTDSDYTPQNSLYGNCPVNSDLIVIK